MNMDCVLDILDVSFHQTCVARLNAGFNPAPCGNFLDIDSNGVIELADTVHLQQAVFFQLALVQSVSAAPNSSLCNIALLVQLVLAGDNIPGETVGLARQGERIQASA